LCQYLEYLRDAKKYRLAQIYDDSLIGLTMFHTIRITDIIFHDMAGPSGKAPYDLESQ